MNSISNKYGMTIIETLMAIVVLSMALLALSGMQISAFDISNNSTKLTKAIVVTQDQGRGGQGGGRRQILRLYQPHPEMGQYPQPPRARHAARPQ
jgi:prepilin-type N-terminal cleavage/methylation domain-containing protein